MRRTKRREAGLTLVEILVAMLIFTIVVYLVLAPLSGLFGVTQRSTQQVTATGLAQNTIEQIKGQWQDQTRYASRCVLGTAPSGTSTPTLTNEDVRGNSTGTSTVVYDSTSCYDNTPDNPVPPIRKITVTATLNGVTSTLVTEVAAP